MHDAAVPQPYIIIGELILDSKLSFLGSGRQCDSESCPVKTALGVGIASIALIILVSVQRMHRESEVGTIYFP